MAVGIWSLVSAVGRSYNRLGAEHGPDELRSRGGRCAVFVRRGFRRSQSSAARHADF
jgi:hypothetical protein